MSSAVADAQRRVEQHERGRCEHCSGGWCELLHWCRLVVLSAGLRHPRG